MNDRDKERRRRWRDDCRILQIVPAPPGWWVLFEKSPHDIEIDNPDRPTIHDFAWIEPVACFALVEEVQRLELLYGEDEWRSVNVTDNDDIGWWPHTRVVPLPWHSGEGYFPGADELRGFRQDWDFLVRPPATLDSHWLVEKFRPKDVVA